MSTYAIGDIQGCRVELEALLERIGFNSTDTVWLLGDLVNRGADSLGTLRLLHRMRDQVRIVLGNHDLHLLAIYYGGHSPSRNDTFDEILSAPDVGVLAEWLCQQNLFECNEKLGFAMAHAGIPHIWSLSDAHRLAREVEVVIRGEHAVVSRDQYFAELYGNKPAKWKESLVGMDRMRLITNYFTRMRMIDGAGELEFSHKSSPQKAPSGWVPWYELLVGELQQKIVFGHWAALDGETGRDDVIALDTGCVWGRTLTALCLDTGVVTSVPAAN